MEGLTVAETLYGAPSGVPTTKEETMSALLYFGVLVPVIVLVTFYVLLRWATR